MKNLNAYILLLLLIVLFSCKKDKGSGIANNKKYLVSFKLDGFKQQILASNNSKLNTNGVVSDTGSIKAMFDSIGYAVYTSGTGGKLINFRSFSTKSFTNSITDSLLSGTYVIAFYAGQKGLVASPSAGVISYPSNIWKDTYAKTVTVAITDSNINQTITLERIVADIQLDIKDPIPANATSFVMTFSTIGVGSYSIFNSKAATQGALPDRTINIPASAIGKSDFKFDYIALGTPTIVAFTLQGFAGGRLLAQQYFPNVSIQKNQQTIYTGNFFGGTDSNNNGFQASVNQVWNPTPTVVNF
ncbi:hypothetical protein G7092_13500 [Mucilaginibacter sp. HC2]|uniref:hypothetical protein n=1 Tax=Mucilaginibacter inviolabilis TaxID=2714892 RepID=UPI00140B9807|nr:hypothetical protein [Mucilaginibacter inviolabilis]NHA04820.1 hypothetical protein [Mucilaginibacter inviolabilis]